MHSRQTATGITAVCAAAVALGVVLGALYRAEAHLAWDYHTATYSYGTSSCTFGDHVDPVSVVFTGVAGEAQVEDHAIHHGWGNTSGTQQYFYDHFCAQALDRNLRAWRMKS
jgi:hypothetical protein